MIEGPGDFAVDVVGESNYQGAIEGVAGGRTEDSSEKIVTAILSLEDSNPYDNKAVAVFLGGKLCGYLDRETARSYRKQLKASGHPKLTAACKAMIVGGWDRGGGDRGHFGIKLDLPVAE